MPWQKKSLVDAQDHLSMSWKSNTGIQGLVISSLGIVSLQEAENMICTLDKMQTLICLIAALLPGLLLTLSWKERVNTGRFSKEEGIVLLRVTLQLEMLKVLVQENSIYYI